MIILCLLSFTPIQTRGSSPAAAPPPAPSTWSWCRCPRPPCSTCSAPSPHRPVCTMTLRKRTSPSQARGTTELPAAPICLAFRPFPDRLSALQEPLFRRASLPPPAPSCLSGSARAGGREKLYTTHASFMGKPYALLTSCLNNLAPLFITIYNIVRFALIMHFSDFSFLD